MRKGMTVVITILVLMLAFSSSFARKDRGEWGENVQKEFSGIEKIDLNTVSGDCIIKTHSSDEVIVDLRYDVEPEGAFEYKFRERGKTLKIEEEWNGRGHRSSSGEVIWTITVPRGTEISFSTASGDLEASGPFGSIEARTASGDIDISDTDGELDISTASGDINIVKAMGDNRISTASGDIHIEDSSDDTRMSTASGDIEVTNMKGDIGLSTASGDIEVSDCRGTFELSCASGSIEVSDVIIEGASEFSTASGSVKVVLSETCDYDLTLSTASGDVTLDYNGNEVKGFFEFEARKRHGKIVCPFDFDDEEEYERWDNIWVRKSFTRKGDSPQIEMSTASGKVVLKK